MAFRKQVFSACALPALCLLGAFNTSAQTFAVNSLADAPAGGVMTNGVCETAPGNGVCTLRAALQKAIAFPGGGIVINLPAGTYVRGSGYPTITASLTIQGAGLASTFVDAAGLDRGFYVDEGAVVTISGITIRNAASPGPSAIGTGILNFGMLAVQDSQIVDGRAGGVWNEGTMTLLNSSVMRNSSSGFNGGIVNGRGPLNVINSLIAYNSAASGAGGFSVQGTGKVTIVNSTISNNYASGAGGAGIRILDAAAVLEVLNSTIAGNLIVPGAGYTGPFGAGIQKEFGTVRLQNTLLANNYVVGVAGDCAGSIVSLDYNRLQTLANCTLTGTTTHNILGGDPLLDSLRVNGGPTLTRALLAGSPALDAIPAGHCTDGFGAPLTADQRGAARPAGTPCDIGAFEGVLPARVLNVNLIGNGDAEVSAAAQATAVAVAVPNWTVTVGAVTIVPYGAAGGYPSTVTNLVPAAHGSNFFAGGPSSPASQATQALNLAAAAAAIDSGGVRFYLSGDFGGFLAQNDAAKLSVTFLDGAQVAIGGATTIGNFNAAYRGNQTGLFGTVATGAVPVGARYAQVTLDMTRTDGDYNDGYADNLRLVLSGGPGTPDLNQHGLTGSWYEPATSGQGFEVEVYADQQGAGSGLAFVSWFTFDKTTGGAERQRWYTMSGPMRSGEPVASLSIYENTGGNFNAPPVTSARNVGTATLSFDTCVTGVLSYAFTDGSARAGVIPLTRLTPSVTCSTTAARPTNADFALSGNWFDPATSGQGLTVEVNGGAGVLFAAWYTYAPSGATAGAAGQRWFTAQGPLATGSRNVAVTIYETTGGLFDAQTFPVPSTVAVGTGTLSFQSCSNAKLDFSFTGGSNSGSTGSISLVRVGPVPPGCV